MQVYSIQEIQAAYAEIKQHLMTVLAITGCDTVSFPYMKEKAMALVFLQKEEDWSSLCKFRNPNNSHNNVAAVIVGFLL